MTRNLGEYRAAMREEALRRGANARDVDVLLADHLGRSVAYVIAHGELEIDTAAVAPLLERRFGGEPLQYVRGHAEFFGHDFVVDDRVLIPRPETEIVVEVAAARAPRDARVVDVGAGSGCIAVSLALARPDLRVVTVDISLGALVVTRTNRTRLGAPLHIVASDLLGSLRGSFDLIVSNPPYIPARDIEGLDANVREHEPHLALTPGPEGTEIIDRFFAQARELIARDGAVILEIGYGQEDAVRELATRHGFGVERVVPDLAGIPRVVVSSPL